jgi:2-desacetyl-2-hydroxyethyl bacteriochlorophyllide A dehydrogenase
MKAAVLYNDREIRLGQVADPQVGPDDVLIAPSYAGICGTDLHIYRGEFHNRVQYPAVLGHEFGGQILEVGQNVKGFKRGDRVTVDPIISCHECPACLTGHPNACRKLALLGVEYDGGFGQYVVAPASHVFALPDNFDMQYVSMVEMYGLACHVLGRGMVQPGESVAILGAGKLGLAVMDVLCHTRSAPSGEGVANPVIAVDLQPFRLETARKLGAQVAINLEDEDPVERVMEITGGLGVDCVIECVGHFHEVPGREAPIAQAVQMIRSAGRVVIAGLGEQLSPVHFKTLVLKEAQIIASRVTLGEFPRAISLMSRGVLHPELLVTHRMSLSEVTGAFERVDQDAPDTIKVVLDIQN